VVGYREDNAAGMNWQSGCEARRACAASRREPWAVLASALEMRVSGEGQGRPRKACSLGPGSALVARGSQAEAIRRKATLALAVAPSLVSRIPAQLCRRPSGLFALAP